MSEERTDQLRGELERFDELETEVMRAFAKVMKGLDPEGGAEVRLLADGLLISGGRYAPPIQMLTHAGRERELTDVEIARIEQFFAEKTGRGHAFVVEGLNDVLTGALEQRGWVQRTPHELFRIRTDQWTAVQRDFEEIEIRPVAGDEVETVLQMAARCWLEREPKEASDLLIGRAFQGIEFGHLHAAWMDGEPVGYAHLFVGDGIGALHAACTLPKARKRGVQQALIESRVALAAELGCEEVWIAGDVGGPTARNAARLGFELVGRRLMLETPESIALRLEIDVS